MTEMFQGSMVLEEEVDMVALRIIRDNFNVCYKRMGEFWIFDNKSYSYKEVDERTAFSIVNDIYNTKCTTKRVEYHYSARLKSGRRFAKLSLQGMSRVMRHTISKGIYHDIDVVNAHPVLLAHLCRQLTFEHPILEAYVQNREEKIRDWLNVNAGFEFVKKPGEKTGKVVPLVLDSRDKVKKYVLKVINGGGCGTTSHPELNAFYHTHQIFLHAFYANDIYKVYRERAIYKAREKEQAQDEKKYQKKDNKRGTALNYYLCELEDNVLEHIEEFLQTRGITYGTLCFDGIMLYIKSMGAHRIDRLLEDLSTYLTNRNGYALQVKEKVMDEGIDLTGLSMKGDIQTTDEDYSQYLLKNMKDDYKYDTYQKELWFYDDDSALWKKQRMIHLRTFIVKVLIPYIQQSPDAKIVEEQTKWIKSDSFQTKMVRMCEPYIIQQRDDDFIQLHFDRKAGLFPLANRKILEMSTGIIREREKTDYFTKTTQREIVDVSPEIRQEILNYYAAMLRTDKPSYRDCLMSCMGYVMTGENNQKIILNFIGEKNGGKSTYLDVHNNILEGFGTWANDRVFIAQKNQACHDSELFSLRGRRMACLSELSKRDSFNAARMKRISGGDTMNLRGAGEKETVSEKFMCVMVLATNEVPECTDRDNAYEDRLWCFNFCNEFKKDSRIVERLAELKDHYFTVLAEYAQKYYENDKIMVKCEEVEKYSRNICDQQNTVKWWCGTQNFQAGAYEDYVEKTQLFERYKMGCEENRKKHVGKIEFYREFVGHYGLMEEVQIRINEGDIERKIRVFRHFREAEATL
jgi:phage/plasmid-associated DNA primase